MLLCLKPKAEVTAFMNSITFNKNSILTVCYDKRYLPVPLVELFSLILFSYLLNICAVSLADQ